ncbi:MAG: DUF308 domain-containing protein [Candidatus Paceibacterota bacterium]
MAEENKKENGFVVGIIDNYVREFSNNWSLIFLTGVLFIIFGLIFFIWPEKTLVFIASAIGLMAIIAGLWIIGIACRVKRIENNYKKMKEDLRSKFFE